MAYPSCPSGLPVPQKFLIVLWHSVTLPQRAMWVMFICLIQAKFLLPSCKQVVFGDEELPGMLRQRLYISRVGNGGMAGTWHMYSGFLKCWVSSNKRLGELLVEYPRRVLIYRVGNRAKTKLPLSVCSLFSWSGFLPFRPPSFFFCKGDKAEVILK